MAHPFKWILVAGLMLATLAGGQTIEITSFPTNGVLDWSVDQTNTWCGLEYTPDLDGPWGRALGEFWNLHTPGLTNSIDLDLEHAVGMDILFMRIVGSTNNMLGEPFDVDTERMPLFVSSDYIDLSKIYRISRFRSGEGHDNSDDYESCRSMKHYYHPSVPDWSQVEVFSPVAGNIYAMNDDNEGYMLTIQSDAYPAFFFTLYHIAPTNTLGPGDLVTAGQPLGTHYGNQTTSDIEVGINTTNGWKLVSFFDVMLDGVFAAYTNRGVAARTNMIITQAERDADPLTCDEGGDFLTPGNIPNWVDLN
jgi:hypothetical protein